MAAYARGKLIGHNHFSKVNYPKLYHLGIGQAIVKSTLSIANENRDWRISLDFVLLLIVKAKKFYIDDLLDVNMKNNIFIIDSSTVDLLPEHLFMVKIQENKSCGKVACKNINP